MQGDIGSIQNQQQFCFVVGQSPKSQIEGLEAGFGATDFIEASGQFLFFDGIGILPIVFEIVVEIPQLCSDPIQRLGMVLIEGEYALEGPFGVDPAQGMEEHIELTGIIT